MRHMKTYKRRNFFIKKDLQGKLILGYFLFVSAGCLFFIFVFALFSADTLTISYTNNDLQLGQTPLMLLKSTLAAHWVFIVVGAFFIVLGAMLLTHRIAGPLFRFEKTLESMKQGDLTDTIYLRSKDEGKELAGKINDFNQGLSIKIRSLNTHAEGIQELLPQLRDEIDSLFSEQTSEINSIMWSLEEKNKKIKNICSSFTIKDEEKTT